MVSNALWVIAGGRDTYILKAFSERFGFDVLESRKFRLSVKTKQRECPCGVILYPSCWWAMIYTSAWGFQHCSVRQIGRCESLNTWDRAQNWLHVFLCVCIQKYNKPLRQSTVILLLANEIYSSHRWIKRYWEIYMC